MIFDLAVIAVLLISAAIAFFRGFIREMLTILGTLGGLAAAWFGGPMLKPSVVSWLAFCGGSKDEPGRLFDLIPCDIAATAASYGSVFIVVVVVLTVASHLLSGWARAAGLGALDRTLGVVFGLARGAVIVALLYLPVNLIAGKEALDGLTQGSKTRVFVAKSADMMMNLVPESFRDGIQEDAEDKAGSVAKAAREKLQEMDVLGTTGDNTEKTDAPPPAAGGYEKEQRQDLNDLIRNNMDE